MKKVSLWNIFITFFKIGAFTFGGGYAMISILEEDLVANKKWLTSADMLEMLVIAESTPGVIAVNTATSVGYRLRGVLGSIVATLGAVLPSFIIICALSFAIEAFSSNKWYQAAFTGIQACVTVLVVNAFIKMSKQLHKDVYSVLLLLAAFAVAVFTKFDVVYLILIGGVLGVLSVVIKDAIAKKKQLPLTESERLDADQNVDTESSQNEALTDEAQTVQATTSENNPADKGDEQ